MNRRGFLGGFGTAVGTIAAAAALQTGGTPSVPPDNMVRNGYNILWRDFTSPVNQNIIVGFWCARNDKDDNHYVSTTLGQCYPSRDWEVIDLTLAKDWPHLTIFASPEERAEVKRRAFDALMTAISV